MKVSEIKLIQEYLAKANLYAGTIDGKQGKNTNKGINSALTAEVAKLPDDWSTWPDKRKAIAYLQLVCQQNSIRGRSLKDIKYRWHYPAWLCRYYPAAC